MIKLTRLDGQPFILNADLIRFVETRPDTFVTLTTGERIVVRESMEFVVDSSIEYQQRKHWVPRAHFASSDSRVETNRGSSRPRKYSGVCE